MDTQMTRMQRINADFLGLIRHYPLYLRHPRFNGTISL
jgi:hypothetical protein